mgnify:CR=1 FL=1
MGAAREKDQADFDLERFIDMFDEAINSKDERVVNALRSLMMMVILTKSESRNPMADRNSGPLRRIYEDLNHLNRRLHDIEDTIRRMQRSPLEEREYQWTDYKKYNMESASQVDQTVLAQIRAAGINKVNGLK